VRVAAEGVGFYIKVTGSDAPAVFECASECAWWQAENGGDGVAGVSADGIYCVPDKGFSGDRAVVLVEIGVICGWAQQFDDGGCVAQQARGAGSVA
jgi:hypothetical protein